MDDYEPLLSFTLRVSAQQTRGRLLGRSALLLPPRGQAVTKPARATQSRQEVFKNPPAFEKTLPCSRSGVRFLPLEFAVLWGGSLHSTKCSGELVPARVLGTGMVETTHWEPTPDPSGGWEWSRITLGIAGQ